MPNEHPFAGKWNHNSRHYPTIGDLVDGCRVVLDVGCGDGTLAHYLARRGHQVIGIDLDPALLPPDSEDVHFMMGDATGLQFADDSFDAVVSVMLLHQTRLELALVEMRRVLKPGGLLVNLGIARDKGVGDLGRTVLDTIAEPFSRRGTTSWQPGTTQLPARLGWQETHEAIDRMLPGVEFRRVPGWRYLATWRRPV
ncbi:MAG: class I SAM-dependent methyltransferase [Brooklawnia sp.]|uniref:class I SAM-dependent methyltransferase n=1 Tax=Brooklawnia sp. TaxID=2699740 RepID=UPI003C746A49